MKNRLNKIRLLLILLIVAACTFGFSPKVHAATTVKIKTSKINLYVGGRKTIKTKIKKKTSKTKLVWKSSKKSVATVNSRGRVTAKKAGKTVITVRIKGKKTKAKCTVTVGKRVTKLKIKTKKSVTIRVGKKHTIKSSVSPSNALYKGVTYKSANKSIATVSKKGVITSKKLGNTIITVRTKGTDKKGKRKTAKITVKVIPPSKTGKTPFVYATTRGTGSKQETIYFVDKNYSGNMKVRVNGIEWNTKGTTLEGLNKLEMMGNLIYSNSSNTMKVSRIDFAEYWTITDLKKNRNYYMKACLNDQYYNSDYALVIFKGNTLNNITTSN